MPSFRRSVLFSLCDRYAAILVNLVITAVLARLVTPEEFGIFGVTVALVALAELLREFGVGAFLVQARTLDAGRIRTAFTVGLLLSLAMAAAVMALAPAVARFYGDHRLFTALSLTSIGFVLVPFSGPGLGLLRREMQFGRVALVNLTGSLAQLTTALALGLLGQGYLSLVLAMVAYQLGSAVAVTMLGPGAWIFRPNLAGWREVVAFGGTASATNLLNMLYTMLPQLALGRFVGLDATGLFNRAATLCQLQDRLVVSVLSPVLLPALARRARGDGEVRSVYLRGVDLGVTVQWPFLVGVFLLAEPIVDVVLGAQWTEAARVIRILTVGYLFLFAGFLTFPTLVAVGRVRDTLTASLISLPPSLLIVGVAAMWGVDATAAAISTCAALQMAVALRFVRRATGFTWRQLLAAIRPGAIATACAAAPAATVLAAAGSVLQASLPIAALAGLAAVAGWLGAILTLEHPLAGEVRHWLRSARRIAAGPLRQRIRLRPSRAE